jgi:nitrate reductase alpha subunit
VRDFRGIPIRVGSRIVYPCREGSALWMNEAEVVEIRSKEDDWGRVRTSLVVRPIKSSSSWRVPQKEQFVIHCVERVAVVR